VSQPLVFVRSVSKTYRRKRATVDALSDVSLEVGKGEFVRLSGPSGSGKTTLLNLIAGLDDLEGHSRHVDIGRLSVIRASSTAQAGRHRLSGL
jgi:ABC-type lipoprotein export system ATPase subunit